jgi:hypothetical protein
MSSGNEGQAGIIEEVTPIVPVMLHKGRYTLYEKPDGGIHLVYQRDDKDEPDHMDIPGMFLKLAKMAGEGTISPMEMMREAMKMRNGNV